MSKRSTRLRVEILEDRTAPSATLISNTVLEPMIPAEPIIPIGRVHQVSQLEGTGAGTFTSSALMVDAGASFQVSGRGYFNAMGNVDINGQVQGVGNILQGHATGTLTFANVQGTVTFSLQGPAQPMFSQIPSTLKYQVVSATGQYAFMAHDSGTFTINYKFNPIVDPPGGAVPPFPVQSLGTFRIATQQSFPIIASANTLLQIHSPAQQLVVRSAAQLTAETGLSATAVASLLNVSSINWQTQMLVVVTAGFGGEGFLSPRPKITSLTEQGWLLTAHWDSVMNNPNQPIPQYEILGNSAEIVLTNRFDGPVDFHFDGKVVLPKPGMSNSEAA